MAYSFKKCGPAPHTIVLVHGGPGAAGEMAPVGRELARHYGVLEPFQTKRTIDGQVEELRAVIEAESQPPVIIAGYSWGAWLACLFAARHPGLVLKLILISCGPLEERYTVHMHEARMARLSAEERERAAFLMHALIDREAHNDALLCEFGSLMGKADSYRPIAGSDEPVDIDAGIHAAIAQEAADLRRTGRLLEECGRLLCPVIALHGDYDPHPYEGVAVPLGRVARDFRGVLLRDCGHTPWREELARERFYELLKKEINLS
jgi:pimeloyl-ACP methyl ester carboxylesterase